MHNLPSPTVLPAATGLRLRQRRALRALALLALVATWSFNLAYFAGGGSVLPQVFFRDAAANALTTAITLDVYLAALAFSGWVLAERRVRRPWGYVLGCFGIGLAVALPLYLANRRERAG
jgi:hypothetical protein